MPQIQSSFILEILGRPVEHVKEALNTLVLKLGSEKGINIIDKEIHEPVLVENSKDLFTSFADVQLEIDSLEKYFAVLFAYMPSNVEITSPPNLTLSNAILNELGNSLIQRLHQYDAIAKSSIAEREFLLGKIKEISPETFKTITTPPEKANAPTEETTPPKETETPKKEKEKIKKKKKKSG